MKQNTTYKQTELGLIPEDWEVKKLGELGKIINGLTYSPENIKENGTLVLRSSNVQNDKIVYDDNVFVEENISFNPTKKDDVLICVRNGSRGLIGKTALIDEQASNVAFGAFMAIYRSNSNNYIYNYFKSNYFFKEVHKNLGATINSINNNDLKKFKIPLPPLPEQKKIADCLSTWDCAIEKQSQLINALTQRKKALMQQLLTGKKRLPGFEGEWKEVKLGSLCKVTTGKLDANAMVENGIYRFYTCAKDYYLINEYKFDTEALLISGNGANVGYIHYYKGKFNAYQRTYVLDKFKEDIFFIKYFLDYFLSQRISNEKKEGNTPYIVLSTLTEMSIKLPSLSEQTAIAEILTIADRELQLQKEKLVQLQTQKKGLMQVLLTGKKRLIN